MTDPGPCIGETDKAGKMELEALRRKAANFATFWFEQAAKNDDRQSHYEVLGSQFMQLANMADALSVSRQQCEPVAWMTTGLNGAVNATTDDARVKYWRVQGLEVTPLYSTPPNVDDARQSGVAEGIEILVNLSESIKKHGNYSEATTLIFISDALSCFRASLTPAREPVPETGVIECPNCHNANSCGDYQGPTCEVCWGEGFINQTLAPLPPQKRQQDDPTSSDYAVEKF